jgi:hypothetical protein
MAFHVGEPEKNVTQPKRQAGRVGNRNRSSCVIVVILPRLVFASPRLKPMPANPILDTEITLSFSPNELSQLDAFAALHGVSLSAFVKSAALDAAHIASAATKKRRTPDSGALWMSEAFVGTIQTDDEGLDLFAPIDTFEAVEEAPEAVEESSRASTPASVAKRGVTGEPSKFARGTGPVWDIRQALGRERVHGLGWTREQMAFVLKLSVVGVRKMEHLGTSPVKSMEARKKLLELAKLLENPGAEICAYIEREEKTLG